MSIPSLYFFEDIITKDSSDSIINELDNDEINKWTPIFNNEKARVVKQFGFKYSYTSYQINKLAPSMPDYILELRDILTEKCKELKILKPDYIFNQCIVNNYESGQGINPHTDFRGFGEIIASFTLGGGASVKFKNKNKNDNIISDEVVIYTTNMSLYIMSGDARYNWTHEIAGRQSDIVDGEKIKRERRISVTFRNVPN